MEKGFSRSFHQNLPVFQNVSSMGNLESHMGILFHKKDGRFVFLVDFADDLKDETNNQRGKAQGRFVKEKKLGPGHERPGNRQHLLLTAAERSAGLMATVGEDREQIIDRVQVVFDSQPVPAQEGAHIEVLRDGQLGKDMPALRYLADPHGHDGIGSSGMNGLSLKDDLPPAGRN